MTTPRPGSGRFSVDFQFLLTDEHVQRGREHFAGRSSLDTQFFLADARDQRIFLVESRDRADDQ